MSTLTFRIKMQPEPEGGFTVTVPALPGCVTWGETYEHAIAMSREAIEGYIEVLEEEGLPIPSDTITEPIEALITVASSEAA
jgi:predicted RNase H-like HicB family nuclease